MVAGTVTSVAVPGAPAWDVVIGDRFIAAVAAPSPDTCASAFAGAAADDAVTVEALVGMVPLAGADAVDSFAIVWWPGDDTTEVTAVVRGDAVVDLTSPGGTRRFDARGIRPWHLADFGAVVALRVTGADAPLDRFGGTGHDVGHARAAVRASAVEWSAAPLRPPTPDASVADADTILVPRPHPGHDDVDTALMPRPRPHDREAEADTIRTPPRAASQDPEPEPRPDAAAPPTSGMRTVVHGALASPAAAQDLPGQGPRVLGAAIRLDESDVAPRGSATAETSDEEPEPPVIRPLPDAGVGTTTAVAPASVPEPDADADDSGGGAQIAAGRLAAADASAGPGPEHAAASDDLAVPAYRIGVGETRLITGPVLIGRRPIAPRIPDPHGLAPELVAVASPGGVVSGTHLELRLEGTRVVATDLRSTNGTIVHRGTGVRRMRAGESIVVAPGTRLDLGDDTIIEILTAPTPPPWRPDRQQAAP